MQTLKVGSFPKSSCRGGAAESRSSDACSNAWKTKKTAGSEHLAHRRSICNGLAQAVRFHYIRRKLPRKCSEKLFCVVEVRDSGDLATKDFAKLLQLRNASGKVISVKRSCRCHPAIMIPESRGAKRVLQCGSDCAAENGKYLKGFLQEVMPKKTVHFLPRSHCQLFQMEKPTICPRRSERNTEQYQSRLVSLK